MQQPPSQGAREAGEPRPNAQPSDTGGPAGQQQSGAENVKGELRSDAQHLGRSAANRMYSEADARKDAAANQAKSVSSALDRAAGELDESSPDWLKSAFRQGAQQVQKFADAIEQKDSRQLVGDIESFARDRPGMFLFGCAAAGFAAARVFKAGGEEGGTQRSQGQSGFSGEQDFRSSQSESGFAPSRRGEFV